MLRTEMTRARYCIREIKLERCCENNRKVLDEAMEELEPQPMELRLLDAPTADTISPILKEIGLTKMNLRGRRFSVF